MSMDEILEWAGKTFTWLSVSIVALPFFLIVGIALLSTFGFTGNFDYTVGNVDVHICVW